MKTVHEHKCELCGSDYTTFSSIDWGICHNCSERAKQQVIMLNPSDEEINIFEDLSESDIVESLFYYFHGEMDVEMDEFLKCQSVLNEIINANATHIKAC